VLFGVLTSAPQRAAASLPDPLLAQQWGVFAIGADSVWSTTTGSGITVAVVDSGSGPHPDLTANLLVGKTYFGLAESPDGNDVDNQGHGTHVAGIVAAASNNGIGGSGVAPNAKIIPIHVLDTNGQGDARDVANGVRFAADSGAKVINLSLGGATESATLTQAITYATEKGALVIAAAGNGGPTSAPKWPAALDLTIAVTAVDSANRAASFNQRGDYIDLAAPGVSIVSTANGDYAALSGTSMAAGFVAGAAALLFAAEPRATNTQVRDILLTTATDIGEPGRDLVFGTGLVNMVAALQALRQLYPPVSTPTVTAVGHIGERLIANLSQVSNVSSIQWFRCTNEGPAITTKPQDCIAIKGATKRRYTTAVADARKTIRIGITYTRDGLRQLAWSATTARFFLIWHTTNTIATRSRTPLNQIFGTSSSGTRTYSVLSGTCRIRNGTLIAPAEPSICRVRVVVSARKPYPRLAQAINVLVS
jgi:type VII secretion-associated serine protease mycosin